MKTTNVVFIDQPFLLHQFLDQAQQLEGINCTIYDDNPVDDEQKIARAKDADVLVVDILSTYYAPVLKALPRLKAIITTSVAVDHIDTSYCAKHGIKVINFPGFNARAVAEASFAYLLDLARHVTQAWQNVLGGGWSSFAFQGSELSGKALGVIGAGNIGREIIRIGQGLNMKILCHTQHPSADRAQSLGITGFSTLEELLSQSDFVVIAIPATAATAGLIGAHELNLMKPTAYLVNVGRWQVVNPLALAEAIYEQAIAGAALDFIRAEPYNMLTDDLRIQEMLNSPNVILLPHIAFNTLEANIRLGEGVITALTECRS